MRKPVYERIRTRRDREHRILILLALIGVVHFAADIAADYLDRGGRTVMRALAAAIVAFATIFSEMYKARDLR